MLNHKENLETRLNPEGMEARSITSIQTRVLSLLAILLAAISITLPIINWGRVQANAVTPAVKPKPQKEPKKFKSFDDKINANANELSEDGRQVFRSNTSGDEKFWGDTLQLHKAIEGANLGGVGPGISPSAALNLGLKVDVDALPEQLQQDIRKGRVNLDDPATTVALLKLNAVLGVKGIFQSNNLSSVGLTCAVCHSTVDNSLAFGIGHRLDGWANRDLDVGKIAAAAPNLQPVANLLGVSVATVQTVLNSWGPGKFDAELFLDGKAFNPQQVTDGVVTGTNVSGATLIPNAFGLAGFNQHTWTGAWGTVTYWNAFVANLELHGTGRFFDPRLNDATKFPIAASAGFGNIRTDPANDRITPKLGSLQFYQLAIPAPKPTAGVDFNIDAAARGQELFREGKMWHLPRSTAVERTRLEFASTHGDWNR